MKKFICIVLTILIILSMAACGAQKAEPAVTTEVATEPTTAPVVETETATEPTTEPTEPEETMPEGFIYDVEGSLAENSTTVSFNMSEEYETLLHGLGFAEVCLDAMRVHVDLSNPADDGDAACSPISLTYNNDVFRLDFSYTNENLNTGLDALEEGWSMYGTKNAISTINISPLNDQEYDMVIDTNLSEEAKKYVAEKNYVRCIQYDFFKFDLEEDIPVGAEIFPTDYDVLYMHYYIKTHNLYNIIRNNGAGTYICANPRILWESYEQEKSETLNGYEWTDEKAELIIYYDDIEETSLFNLHMTLIDWCFSEHNKTGWTYVNDTTICSPDGKNVSNANQKIVNLAKKNENNQYVITLP